MKFTILFFVLFIETLNSASAKEINLFALNASGAHVWKIKVSAPAKLKSCVLESSVPSKPDFFQKKAVLNKECERLKDLLDDVEVQVSRNEISHKQLNHLYLIDEPNYEFEYKSQHFYLNFIPPKECELSPSGVMYPCVYHKLTPAHQLLVFLRSYRKELKIPN